jgi:hypothetical protein
MALSMLSNLLLRSLTLSRVSAMSILGAVLVKKSSSSRNYWWRSSAFTSSLSVKSKISQVAMLCW